MAWTTPRTWTTGEVVTAAMMNSHVRDNLSIVAGTAQPRCCVYRNATQSIPNATQTAISFDSAHMVYGSMWAVGVPTRIVLPYLASYWLHARVIWQYTGSPTTGLKYLNWRLNGSAFIASSVQYLDGGVSDSWSMECSTLFNANANDYVEATIYHAYGSAINILGSGGQAGSQANAFLVGYGS